MMIKQGKTILLLNNSRPKWAKCIPIFRPKRHKNPTRWGGTYLYSLYKGVPPPPDNTLLDLHNSSYSTQPHSLILLLIVIHLVSLPNQ